MATELRYRIVCYELEGETETVILDTTARAFIAVTGTLDENGTMHGKGTHAGPLPLPLDRPADRRGRATPS